MFIGHYGFKSAWDVALSAFYHWHQVWGKIRYVNLRNHYACNPNDRVFGGASA
jgi:hypothetical protein